MDYQNHEICRFLLECHLYKLQGTYRGDGVGPVVEGTQLPELW